MAAPPTIIVEDRQFAVLAAHVGTTTRRLVNAKRQVKATVAKAEAAQGQTTINQRVAAKMLKILIGLLCNILNITTENSG